MEFRDQEFGTYRQEAPGKAPTTTLAGKHLDLYEQGARSDETLQAPLNLVYPIARLIVPTLFYQNPRVTAIPDSRDPQAAEDAFYVAELLNRDLRDSDFRFKETSQAAVFDSFLLGFGVVKVGYATEFGPDILPTDKETKQKFRARLKQSVEAAMQAVGLKPPTPEGPPEPEKVHADLTIQSESPYLSWISPFDFVVDPRARDLTDARWVAQRVRRTIAEIKRDRRYGKAKHDLVAEAVDDDRLQASFVEEFQTADVWEIHYKDTESPTGIRVLTLACTQEQTQPLGHQDSEYDLGGWQYEWLTPNKHGHRLYPISTIGVIRPLLDRINSSLDAILEQVDKFITKIAHNERVGEEGQAALEDPTIGAVVKVDGTEDVRSAIQVITMQQVAADMVGFVNQLVDLVLVIVGVTRAQFTGISTANTATEAQLGQGGQNVRRNDEANTVAGWSNRVVTKHWRVKAQFQDLEAIDLPMEQGSLDPMTGMAQTQWYPPIDAARAQRLKNTRFRLHLEVGSIQKPNLEIIRAQFEQMARALMEPIVTQGLALEGKRLSAQELIRQWTRFFTEYGMQGLEKIVVPVQDPALLQALQTYGQKPEQTPGVKASNGRSLAGSVPNMADMISRTAGEKGMGVPGA